MADSQKSAVECLRDYLEENPVDEQEFQELRDALALIPDISQCDYYTEMRAKYLLQEMAYCESDQGTEYSRNKKRGTLKYSAANISTGIYAQLFINPQTRKRYRLVENIFSDPVFSFGSIDKNAKKVLAKLTIPKGVWHQNHESLLQDIVDYTLETIERDDDGWVDLGKQYISDYVYLLLALFDMDPADKEFSFKYQRAIDDGLSLLSRSIRHSEDHDLHYLALDEKRDTIFLHEAVNTAKKQSKEMERLHSEAEDTLHTIKATAGSAAVGVIYTDHAKAARRHAIGAVVWLLLLVAIFGSIIWSLYLILLKVGPLARFAEEPANLHYLSIKILFFFSLFYALFWCGRMYRSERQMQAVYAQSALTLRTYDSFAKSAKTPEAADRVLLVAVRSVFSPYHSCYVGGAEQPVESASSAAILKRFESGKAD